MNRSLNLREIIRSNERLSVLISHALVSLMMACLAISIVQFGTRLVPTWNGWFLPWLILLVSMEAMYSQRLTRGLSIMSQEWLIFRITEVVVILIGLKVVLYLVDNPAQLLADLALWQRDFFNTFFTPGYLGSLLLVFIFWVLSARFSELLARMEGDERLLEKEVPVGFSEDRQHAREQISDLILYLGAAMVLMTTAVRIELEAVWGVRPPLHGSVINLVLYFMLALALLSQTQFTMLRAGWSWERIPLTRNIGTHWVVFSLLFLLLLSALALVLPTRYSVGILTVLGYLVGFIVSLVLFLWGLGAFLISMLLSLFRGQANESAEAPPMPVMPPIPPEAPGGPQTPLPWLELLKSALFWLVFLGVILYSFYQYFSQRQELVGRLRRLPGSAWLLAAWRWLRAWLSGVNRAVGAAVSSGLERLRNPSRSEAAREAWRFVNLRRLSPRERVLFFYYAMVRRGRERGLPRREDQTPFEYQEALQSALSGAEQDLTGLTEAFVEARYSLHPVSPEQASRAQRWWQRVRRLLRGVNR